MPTTTASAAFRTASSTNDREEGEGPGARRGLLRFKRRSEGRRGAGDGLRHGARAARNAALEHLVERAEDDLPVVVLLDEPAPAQTHFLRGLGIAQQPADGLGEV